MKTNILVLLVVIIYTASLFAQIGTHIPSDRLPDLEEAWWNPTEMVLPWQNAGCLKQLQADGGLEIDKFIDVTQDLEDPIIQGNTLTQKILYIIDPDNSDFNQSNILFYFPPGVYEFDETIEINRNNVVFKGAGAEETTLLFRYDYIKYEVEGIPTAAGWEYDDSFKIYSSSNIGFEDFKITHSSQWIETRPFTGDEYIGGRYFVFSYSDHCWINGIQSNYSERHHISIGSGNNHIEVRECYINESIHRTSGGNGYGVVIGNDSHHCLIENNVFRKLRHSMIFGNHAYHNVLGYNYSRENDSQGSTNYEPTDICFHGASGTNADPPEFNLVEGNIAEFIQFDKAHGENGINNLIFRNRAPKIADWDLNPLYPNNDNDDQIIVNCRFYYTDFSITWPWSMHGEGHYKANIHCFDWLHPNEGYWGNGVHSDMYWEDISYYKDTRPDFIPEYQWPYHPTNGEPGTTNCNNPAKDRWDSGGIKTVLAQWNHLNINEPSRDQYDAYFYTNNDPLTGNTQKELTIVYLTYHNQSTQIQVTIEQNNNIIGDWNNKVVDLCIADYS